MIMLSQQQANQLKHQPDTGQGLRDQALMCLLLNEKLPIKVISNLRATAVDTDARVLVLSDDEEMPLTEETFATLQAYVARTHPSVMLLQRSISNGELDGGGMGVGPIYKRIEHLGEGIGLKEKLTVEACFSYVSPQGTCPPSIRKRTPRQAADIQSPVNASDMSLISPPSFTHPRMSIDTLIEGLGNLDAWLGKIMHIQQEGNITPDLDLLCEQADAQCAALSGELLALQQVVTILPLHCMLLRLFSRIDEAISEPMLLHLEMRATASFLTSFEESQPRSVAEERAVQVCESLLRNHVSEEKLTSCQDLLRGIAIYAGMHAQRKREKATAGRGLL
jgi:hypothetical protein